MKKVLALVLVFLLAGCSHSDNLMARGISVRERLLSANGCGFDAEVTADFGDKIYSFAMQCQSDQAGNLNFTVTKPESISGITGIVSANGGKLTFAEEALAFSLLADGEVSPVSAPWLLIKTLRSGYMKFSGMDGELLRLTIDDSYAEDALQLEIWLDSADVPVSAEILWQGRRILSLRISNYVYL